MITLDYVIHNAPSPNVDLRNVGASDLHYSLFLGDITFRIDDSDMSASWGWIPIIDFAACLSQIVEDLQPGQTLCFECTESEHRIDFTMNDGNDGVVEIRATYAETPAHVAQGELMESTRAFLQRVLADVSARNPSLIDSATIRGLYHRTK